MKICSLCKSKYDDRVDFCFRDGTPLMPVDEPVQEPVEPAADLFSSATRPFIVQPDGPPKPVDTLDALDVPKTPDRFATGDGLDVPEPRFGIDPSSLDAPEPGRAGFDPSALDAPDPTLAPVSSVFDATDVPAGPSFLDAPEPPAQLDAPEPVGLSAAADVPEANVPEEPAGPGLSHSETMVPADEPAPMAQVSPIDDEPEVEQPSTEDDLDDSFAALDEGDDEVSGFGVDTYDSPVEQPQASNRTLFMVFGAVAVVAVVAILFILLSGPEKPGSAEPTPPPVVEVRPAPAPVPPPAPVEQPPEEPVEQPGEDQAVADILEMPTDEPIEQPPEEPVEQPAPQPKPQPQPQPKPQPQPQPQPKPQPKPQPQPPATADNGGEASPWGTSDGGGSATTDGGGRDIWGSGQSTQAATKGTLTIRSNPMGAMVFVGNEMVGRTPVVGKELPPGSHMVRVELDGYSTVSKVANVKAGQPSDLGTVQLASQAPVTGYVTLWADNLIGAKVYIDNQYVGELPVKVELNEGKHAFFVQPAEGEAFTRNRDVHFDVQGIGISIDLGQN